MRANAAEEGKQCGPTPPPLRDALRDAAFPETQCWGPDWLGPPPPDGHAAAFAAHLDAQVRAEMDAKFRSEMQARGGGAQPGQPAAAAPLSEAAGGSRAGTIGGSMAGSTKASVHGSVRGSAMSGSVPASVPATQRSVAEGSMQQSYREGSVQQSQRSRATASEDQIHQLEETNARLKREVEEVRLQAMGLEREQAQQAHAQQEADARAARERRQQEQQRKQQLEAECRAREMELQKERARLEELQSQQGGASDVPEALLSRQEEEKVYAAARWAASEMRRGEGSTRDGQAERDVSELVERIKRELQAEKSEAASDVFDAIDVNKDGLVDKEEFSQAIRAGIVRPSGWGGASPGQRLRSSLADLQR